MKNTVSRTRLGQVSLGQTIKREKKTLFVYRQCIGTRLVKRTQFKRKKRLRKIWRSQEKWTLLRFTLERKKKTPKWTLLRFTLLRFYALRSYAKSEKTQNTVSRTRLGQVSLGQIINSFESRTLLAPPPGQVRSVQVRQYILLGLKTEDKLLKVRVTGEGSERKYLQWNKQKR